jgi:hypothetical protein
VLDEVYQIAALKSGAYMVEPISQLEFLILMLWPGAAGGLASFLNGLRLQHYKNNKYLAKFGIEVLGGTVTASSLAYVFHEYALASVFAFLIGFAWSQVLQRLRTKITKIVEAALGD